MCRPHRKYSITSTSTQSACSIRHTTDITFLTETKFKKSDLPIYKREWRAGLLASCTPEVRAQAGVALLFRKGLAVTFLGDGNDRNGRVVWALVEINTKKLLIIGVYAPSHVFQGWRLPHSKQSRLWPCHNRRRLESGDGRGLGLLGLYNHRFS